MQMRVHAAEVRVNEGSGKLTHMLKNLWNILFSRCLLCQRRIESGDYCSMQCEHDDLEAKAL